MQDFAQAGSEFPAMLQGSVEKNGELLVKNERAEAQAKADLEESKKKLADAEDAPRKAEEILKKAEEAPKKAEAFYKSAKDGSFILPAEHAEFRLLRLLHGTLFQDTLASK